MLNTKIIAFNRIDSHTLTIQNTQHNRVEWIRRNHGICSPTHPAISKIISIGKNTLEKMGLNPNDYQIVVADDDIVNACFYCSEGERVIQFNRGLIDFLKRHNCWSEEALQFVLGHEVGHALDHKDDSNKHYCLADEYSADISGLEVLNTDPSPQSPLIGLTIMKAFEAEFNTTHSYTYTHPQIHRREVNLIQIIRSNYWKNLRENQTPISQDEIPREHTYQFDSVIFESENPEEIFTHIMSHAIYYQDIKKGIRWIGTLLDTHISAEGSFPHTKKYYEFFNDERITQLKNKIKEVNPTLKNSDPEDEKRLFTYIIFFDFGLSSDIQRKEEVDDLYFLYPQDTVILEKSLKDNLRWKNPIFILNLLIECSQNIQLTYTPKKNNHTLYSHFKKNINKYLVPISLFSSLHFKDISESILDHFIVEILNRSNTLNNTVVNRKHTDNRDSLSDTTIVPLTFYLTKAIFKEKFKHIDNVLGLIQILQKFAPYLTKENN